MLPRPPKSTRTYTLFPYTTPSDLGGEEAKAGAMTDTPDPAAAAATSPAIAALSFEAAMGELETIVRRLESGDVSLEESVTLYERGHALRAHCEARLAAAQARSEKVSLGAADREDVGDGKGVPGQGD